MADFPADVALAIKHIETLIKELLDVTTKGASQTRRATSVASSIASGKELSPKEIKELETEIAKIEQERIAYKEREQEIEKELKSSLIDKNQKLVLSQELEEKRQLAKEAQVEQLKEEIKLEEAKYQIRIKSKKLDSKEINAHKDAQKNRQVLLQSYQEEMNHVDLLRRSTGDLLKKATGLNMEWQEMASVRFIKSFMEAENLGSALKSVGKGIVDVLGPANLLGNAFSLIADTWKQAIFDTDRLIAQFNKAAGTTGQYTTEILSLRKEYSEYVLNIEDSFKAYENLMTKLSGFRDLNKETRKEIAGHAAMMEKLGVSYEDTAGFMETANLALGMTTTEAMNTQMQFVKLADGMKMTADELIKGFRGASGALAAYGKDAPRIFANVAKFADKAGLSVQSLLNITQQFDTFENAAGQVGKLNAMLGGSYLSTVDMLNATEDERLRKIKESIDLAGIQFDSMGKYQKLYLTQTLGLQSVEEASKLLGGSMSDLNARLDEQNLSQKEAAERAQKFSTIGNKLESILQNIVFALEPIIDFLHLLLDAIAKVVGFLNENEWVFWTFVTIWVAAKVAVNGVIGSLKSLWGGIIALGKGILGFIPNLFSAIGGLFGLGTAGAAATPAVASTGVAATGATAPMTGFGMAALMVGGAIALVVGSVALLVFALTGLIKAAGESSASIWELAAGITLLVGGILAMAAIFPVALVGLGALAVGFALLGVGLWTINGDKISSLSNLFGNLANTLKNFDSAMFDKIVSGIEKVADAIDDVDGDNFLTFGYMFKQIGDSVSVAANNAGVENLNKMVSGVDTAVQTTRQAANNASSATTQRIASTIKESSSGVVNNTPSKVTIEQPIVIELNGRELGRAIAKWVNDNNSPGTTQRA